MSAAGTDARASAPPIAIGDTSAATNATSFTMEPGEKLPSGFTSLFRSAWWYLDPTADGWIKLDTELSTSGADTLIGVWADVDGVLVEVAYDDDAGVRNLSLLNWYGYTGIRYYIQVTSWDESGTLSYVLRCATGTGGTPPPRPEPPPPPPSNDNFADAIEIPYNGTSALVSNKGATAETGEQFVSSTDRTIWYKVVAPATETVGVDLFSSVPSVPVASANLSLRVSTGTGLTGRTDVASSFTNPAAAQWGAAVVEHGNLPELSFEATAGTTYHIQVASNRSDSGEAQVAVRVGKRTYSYGDWQGDAPYIAPLSINNSWFYQNPTGNYTGGRFSTSEYHSESEGLSWSQLWTTMLAAYNGQRTIMNEVARLNDSRGSYANGFGTDSYASVAFINTSTSNFTGGSGQCLSQLYLTAMALKPRAAMLTRKPAYVSDASTVEFDAPGNNGQATIVGATLKKWVGEILVNPAGTHFTYNLALLRNVSNYSDSTTWDLQDRVLLGPFDLNSTRLPPVTYYAREWDVVDMDIDLMAEGLMDSQGRMVLLNGPLFLEQSGFIGGPPGAPTGIGGDNVRSVDVSGDGAWDMNDASSSGNEIELLLDPPAFRYVYADIGGVSLDVDVLFQAETLTQRLATASTFAVARSAVEVGTMSVSPPTWEITNYFGIPNGGDSFASAAVIPPPADATTATMSNAGLTMEAGEPRPQALMFRSMWWTYTPAVSGLLRLTWSGECVVTIYTGTALSNLVDVQSMFGTGGLMYQEVDAGVTYSIQMSSYGDYDHSQSLSVWAPVAFVKVEVPVDEVTQLGPGGSPPASLGEIVGGSGALSSSDDSSYFHQYGASEAGGPAAIGATFTVHFPAQALPDLPLLALYQTWRSKVNAAVVTASGGAGDQQMWPKVTCDRPNETTAQRGAYGVPTTDFRWHRHPWFSDIDAADVESGEITYAGHPYSEIWPAGAPTTHERFVSYLATTAYFYNVPDVDLAVDVLVQAETLTQRLATASTFAVARAAVAPAQRIGGSS